MIYDRRHSFPFGIVRHAAEGCLSILCHVGGIAGLSQNTGDGWVGEDVLEGKLRPGLAAEVGGPFRNGTLPQLIEIISVHEWPVYEYRYSFILEHRQHAGFRATLGVIKRKILQLEAAIGSYANRTQGNEDYAHCLESMPKAMEKVLKAKGAAEVSRFSIQQAKVKDAEFVEKAILCSS